jgi:hypothetical protein
MLKLKRGKIQTNIGSGYDRLSRVEKEQLLASLKERLGPRMGLQFVFKDALENINSGTSSNKHS